MLGTITIFLFLITSLLSYIESYLGKYKIPIYYALGAVMVLCAALREVGIDPDSEAYESTFLSDADSEMGDRVEFSFILISNIVHLFSNDVHVLFLVYAAIAISLKFIAFRQISEHTFLPVVVYIGYFYIFHEMMQIRSGVMAGFFLLALKPICEKQRLRAFLLLLAGLFFHYSALVLFPLIFMSNKPMTIRSRFLWALIIPIGYFLYFYGLSFLLDMSTNIPYIGGKIASYQWGTQMGTAIDKVNVFNPLQLLMVFLYYYLLFYHDLIVENNKMFPLLIKIYALGVIAYPALSSFPVMAERIQLLLLTVHILLFSFLYYTVKPKWAGISLVVLTSLAFLNIALPSINFALLWKSAKMK